MSTLSTFKPSRAWAHSPARPGVPWGTVATLAVGMSCTSAFWLVALAGAVGSPERYQTPFATWVMMSIALLPLYGAGVLGTLMLAKRWFGPKLRWPSTVLATGLLLIVSGTLVGITAIAASSAYDYSLQLPHIGSTMAGMASCTGDCIPKEKHDIFALHVRGVQLVSQKLLLTNAVLVLWMIAMWGGRIKLSRSSRHDDGAVDASAHGSLANDVRLLLVGMVAGAALIHVAIIPAHLAEWPAAGMFFIALTAAELAVAGLVLARFRERATLPAAIALSVVPLVAWLWSRTVGLPFGPEPGVAEAVGLPDVLACILEFGVILAALALLKPGRLSRPARSAHVQGLVALALIGVVSIGFVATGPSWFDAFGVHASQSAMEMSQ